MVTSAEDNGNKISRAHVHMAVFVEASWELISDCQLLLLPGVGQSLIECSPVSVGKFRAVGEVSMGYRGLGLPGGFGSASRTRVHEQRAPFLF